MRPRTIALVLGAALASCADLSAQPAGNEFRVNSYTTASQRSPAITGFSPASSPFVVVWSGQGSGGANGIAARRFQFSGIPVEGDLDVSASPGAAASVPDVASRGPALADGFVVAWTAVTPGGLAKSHARLFGATGFVGAPFRVDASTSGIQYQPAVAAAADGTFVVVWGVAAVSDGPQNVQAQRFSAAGAPLGAELRVNATTSGSVGHAVAADGSGGFVVAWDEYDGDGIGIFVRRISPDGQLVGAPVRINTNTTGDQSSAKVAAGGAGTFLVAWESMDPVQNVEVFARRLDSVGRPLGGELRLNTYTTGTQGNLAVAGDALGTFLVVWRSTQDGSSQSVHGRLVVNGTTLGGEFRVNTYTTNSQSYPRAAARSAGSFVVVWTSNGQDGAFDGVFTRLVCLHGDATGNGVVDVTDILYLINNLFAGGPAPVGCADVTGEGDVNVTDVLYLINYLFAGGPAPL